MIKGNEMLLAEICEVSYKTVLNWKRGKTKPPKSAKIIGELIWHRDLGAIFPEWEGWRIEKNMIVNPSGECWTKKDLEAWWIDRQILASYRKNEDYSQIQREKAFFKQVMYLRRWGAYEEKENVGVKERIKKHFETKDKLQEVYIEFAVSFREMDMEKEYWLCRIYAVLQGYFPNIVNKVIEKFTTGRISSENWNLLRSYISRSE